MNKIVIFFLCLFIIIPLSAGGVWENPQWFETCSESELALVLKNPQFNVNMIYGVINGSYDNAEMTPLMFAVKNKNPKITEMMISSGADVNYVADTSYRLTAAFFAVQNENSEILELLIKARADMKHFRKSWVHEDRGETLLHVAARNANPEIFKLLLKNGADPFMKDEMGGYTVLMECARVNSNPEVIKVLLAAELKINDQNDFGENSLTIAIEESPNPEIIKILIEKGGDLSVNGHLRGDRNVIELADSNPALKNSAVLQLIKTKYSELKK